MTATAALVFTLAAAHRVIDRVHHHSANVRTASLPAGAAGFPTGDVHVIDVSDLTDRRETIFVDPAHFAGRHFHQRVTSFEVVQNCLLTGAAGDLATAARA